ncbi:MAG: hypothetical protein M1828_003993 [Chrysothrix sp. TS-e1954]|nr:MAG: hypothetical protein M1828_003993 [Chrysothrix sp. TS-e1954]
MAAHNTHLRILNYILQTHTNGTVDHAMHDPFPVPSPSLLTHLTTTYISNPLHLSTLPLHIHEILLSALAYHLICTYLSPIVSRALFPRTYPNLPWRTRLNWDVHVVSLVQSICINTLALWVYFNDEQRTGVMHEDWRLRVWGYTGALGLVEAIAVGYFLWDFVICLVYVRVFGVGLLAHAVSALVVYLFGFVSPNRTPQFLISILKANEQKRPFVNAYAPIFILYELSSPFLNIHWFCDKLDLTGSDLQLYNGVILITSFFGSRLVWGVWNTVSVFSDVWSAVQYQDTVAGKAWLAKVRTEVVAEAVKASGKSIEGARDLSDVLALSASEQVLGTAVPRPVPTWLAVMYLTANCTLTLLNVYWFGKMIETIRARFEPPLGTKVPESTKSNKSSGKSRAAKKKE